MEGRSKRERNAKMRLSKRFPSCKNRLLSPSKISSQSARPSSSASLKPSGGPSPGGGKGGERGRCIAKCSSMWSVYLIVSTQLPRTYVGVTTNFFRRLKQHNGELKGGAKASSAGRPWSLGCLIQGFKDRREACKFESKWKSLSRKMSRKNNKERHSTDLLLQHREAALNEAKTSFDCNNLRVEWSLKP